MFPNVCLVISPLNMLVQGIHCASVLGSNFSHIEALHRRSCIYSFVHGHISMLAVLDQSRIIMALYLTVCRATVVQTLQIVCNFSNGRIGSMHVFLVVVY